jgi:2-methylcitrate dehydratase PrpD
MTGCEKLAGLILDAAERGAPDDAVEKATFCLLDFVTCTILGAADEVGRAITSYVSASDQAAECTVVGADAKAAAGAAALANGTMAHALDFDDVSVSMAGHPSAPVFPAALALGEKHGLAGGRVLLASILGIETECKLGGIMNPALSRGGFHPSSVLGTLGAAACAGVLRGLDRASMAHALGIAASLACGIKANFGTMTKPLHVGVAARNGIMAAALARRRWTAAPDAIEGRSGLLASFAAGGDLDALDAAFGNPFEVVSPGIRAKRYPSCAGTHCAIDALAELAAAHELQAADVRRIRCRVTPFARTVAAADVPATGREARFSVPFCLAVRLSRGSVGPEHFRDALVAAGPIADLMGRIEVVADPALSPDGFSGFAAAVELTLGDGRKLTRTRDVDPPPGPGESSAGGIVEKFRRHAEPLLGECRAQRILDGVKGFAALQEIRTFMGLFGSF